MEGRQTDVVGGVNKFIQEQQELKDPASLAIVRFDHEAIERFREMKPIAEVTPLKREEFQPRGWTPLLDAVGGTIAQLDEDWKTEKPDRCIVVIVTDGQENHSREYTKAKVKAMIEARQRSNLWAFIYLGANVDAFAEASGLGIAAANTAGYTSSILGTATAYAASSDAVRHMRATGQTVSHNLGVANLGEDPDAHGGSVPDPLPKSPLPQPTAGVGTAWGGPIPSAWKPPVGGVGNSSATTWSPPG